jgi:hypothetical protein
MNKEINAQEKGIIVEKVKVHPTILTGVSQLRNPKK